MPERWRSSSPRLAGALIGVCFLSACFSGNLARERWHQPLDQAWVEQLIPGEATLLDCLAALGAPLRVEEHGQQTLLIWGWREVRGFQVTASVPLGDRSVNLSWTDQARYLDGVVAFLGPDGTLLLLRQGQLGSILPIKRPRPRLVTPD